MGIAIEKDDPASPECLTKSKTREAMGYAYEGAEASVRITCPPSDGAKCHVISPSTPTVCLSNADMTQPCREAPNHFRKQRSRCQLNGDDELALVRRGR